MIWRNDYYWATLKEDCKKLCLSCKPCQKHSIAKSGYDPQTLISACLPMDYISVDLIGPLPSNSQGNSYVLIAVDIFTRFVFLKAIPDKKAMTIATALYEIFCNFGQPKILQFDNGSEFINEIIRKLSKLFNFDHRKTSPYYPQGNGIVERNVRNTIEFLKKRLDGENDRWSKILPGIQLCLNLRISVLHN